jgi:hypothetical protein
MIAYVRKRGLVLVEINGSPSPENTFWTVQNKSSKALHTPLVTINKLLSHRRDSHLRDTLYCFHGRNAALFSLPTGTSYNSVALATVNTHTHKNRAPYRREAG